MPGPSAFNRRNNPMAEKTASVSASAKQLPPPAAPAKKKAKRRPLPPPVPPMGLGRVNPFASKRGSK